MGTIKHFLIFDLGSESEGGEGDDEEEEEPSRRETGDDKEIEADDDKDDTDINDDASPAPPMKDPVEDVGELAVKDEEEDVEDAVVEPRTLRRREDVKATAVTTADVTESVEGKVDTVVAPSVESPRVGGANEEKKETEKVVTEDGESVSEAKAAAEVEGDDELRLDVMPEELPKSETVEQAASGDEKVEKKPGKPRTRRLKASMKVTVEASEKAEDTMVKAEDVGSDKDVAAAATETEEQAVVKTAEEEKVDEEEKQEKGRKRPKVNKVKPPFEKTPKSKGKLEKGDRPKGRPPKLKLEAAATPGENVEVKTPKKRLKRKLVEKAGHDVEGSSNLTEKKAQLEVPDTKVSLEKTEAKAEAVADDVLDHILPSNDAACSASDVVTDASSIKKCASPDHQGSPTAEAPKLSDSVSVDVGVAEEIAEKAPDLSPVTTAGVEQGKDIAIAATSQPEAASTDVHMSPASKLVASALIFDNTPPSTPEHAMPEHSEETSSVRSSNQPDEVHSTKSEYEANLEVAALMIAASGRGGDDSTEVPTQACESPIACDMSTVSNSSGGSSGNAPGSESEGPPSGSLQKDDDDSGEPLVKRRKRTHKRPTSGVMVTEKAKHRLMPAPTSKPEREY